MIIYVIIPATSSSMFPNVTFKNSEIEDLKTREHLNNLMLNVAKYRHLLVFTEQKDAIKYAQVLSNSPTNLPGNISPITNTLTSIFPIVKAVLKDPVTVSQIKYKDISKAYFINCESRYFIFKDYVKGRWNNLNVKQFGLWSNREFVEFKNKELTVVSGTQIVPVAISLHTDRGNSIVIHSKQHDKYSGLSSETALIDKYYPQAFFKEFFRIRGHKSEAAELRAALQASNQLKLYYLVLEQIAYNRTPHGDYYTMLLTMLSLTTNKLIEEEKASEEEEKDNKDLYFKKAIQVKLEEKMTLFPVVICGLIAEYTPYSKETAESISEEKKISRSKGLTTIALDRAKIFPLDVCKLITDYIPFFSIPRSTKITQHPPYSTDAPVTVNSIALMHMHR